MRERKSMICFYRLPVAIFHLFEYQTVRPGQKNYMSRPHLENASRPGEHMSISDGNGRGGERE